MWLLKVLPGAFRIFLCFGQCHCMHPPSLSGAWSKCFSTRWAKLLLSVETFTLMKTCCTFLARPEACQVRREVSLCPLGSKIGHKCKIMSELETFQKGDAKMFSFVQKWSFYAARSLREDLKVFHESLSNLSGLSKHSQHAMLLTLIYREIFPTATHWTFNHEPFVLQRKS